MKSELYIEIASVPDREEVVAEVWCGDKQFGELSKRKDALILEVYPHPNAQPWVMPFEAVVSALNDAKKRLLGEKTGSEKTGSE